MIVHGHISGLERPGGGLPRRPLVSARSGKRHSWCQRGRQRFQCAGSSPILSNAERLALPSFLAGYSGLTRQAYELDLRQYASWCHQHHVRLFSARRADIEYFARDLEALGRARATITRRLSTIAGFYRYAVEEELLDHSPAAHVRRPRIDYAAAAYGAALAREELLPLPQSRDWRSQLRSHVTLDTDLESEQRCGFGALLAIAADAHRIGCSVWPRHGRYCRSRSGCGSVSG